MAITLRTVTGSELTHEQLDTNFSSLLYSGSVTGNTLTLHYTSSEFSPSNLTLPIISSSYAVTSSMTTAISGTSNYIPIFSGNNTLETSNIYQDSNGRVGIGAEPQTCASLEVDSAGGKVGFILPIVEELGTISSPASGLMVFNISEKKVAINKRQKTPMI